MSPIIPHITSESLAGLRVKNDINWPKVNKEYLKSDEKLQLFKLMEKKEHNYNKR